MYDHVKGAEMAFTLGGIMIPLDECIDIINKGKDWFLIKNPQAYMILLD